MNVWEGAWRDTYPEAIWELHSPYHQRLEQTRDIFLVWLWFYGSTSWRVYKGYKVWYTGCWDIVKGSSGGHGRTFVRVWLEEL